MNRKAFKHLQLAGTKEECEKFKIHLIKDIKTFLFGKWEKPWQTIMYFSSKKKKPLTGFYNVSGRKYNKNSSINLVGVQGKSPFFITLASVRKQKGKILDPSKISFVMGFTPLEEVGDEWMIAPSFDDADVILPKPIDVINVDFVSGIKKPGYVETEFERKEKIEYVENFLEIVGAKKRLPKIHFDQRDACYYTYTPITFTVDRIHMVKADAFKTIEEFYSTLFHEIVHSTKNPSRTGRGKIKRADIDSYAAEELVAEMGAMMICTELGLKYQRQNSITYLKGWLQQGMKNGNTTQEDVLIEAFNYACDAVDFLLKDIDIEKLIPESVKSRIDQDVETVADQLAGVVDKFRIVLKKFFAGKFKGNIINIVNPSKNLLDAGLPDQPIVIRPSVLKQKIEKHQLNYDHLEILPVLISNPIFIFNSATIPGTFNIITEKYNTEGLLCCSIHPDRKINRMVINEIKSIHGRRVSQIDNWIEKGLTLFVDKSKIRKALSDSGFNSPKSESLWLSIAAKLDKKKIEKADFSKNNKLNGYRKSNSKFSQVKEISRDKGKILSEGKITYSLNSITALSGLPNITEPTYKTLLIGLRLESYNEGNTKTHPSKPLTNTKTFTQFKYQPQKAIRHLLKIKDGEAISALYRPDIGDIDIIWGENDPITNKGFGLKHIVEKHGAEIEKLGFKIESFIALVVEHGTINLQAGKKNRIALEGQNYRVIIELMYKGQNRNWLLTVFDLTKKPG